MFRRFHKKYDFTKFQVELTAQIEESAESKQKDSATFQITQFVVPYFKDCSGMVGTLFISYNAIEILKVCSHVTDFSLFNTPFNDPVFGFYCTYCYGLKPILSIFNLSPLIQC